jgi:hypothetical protein
MEYSKRYQELNTLFRLGIDTHLTESNIDICHFSFQSKHETGQSEDANTNSADVNIVENMSFVYPIFMPGEIKRADNAILLLHGLNERNWNKYLTWAEYLCSRTGKPVILFPIAFHMNRSPLSWSNPRALQPIMNLRRQLYGDDRSLSFANVALSERISEKPYRFYSSGRQSIMDLSTLFVQIKMGEHDLFKENAHIDIFAYSIGAFLAEITMLTNPGNLFSDSKLFLFCGGGIFSSMVGQSRSIMDKRAFQILYDFYLNHFVKSVKSLSGKDRIFDSFNSMISTDRNKIQRELFFNQMGNRLKGILLKNDKVMISQGIPEALGVACSASHIARMDFSYQYTHENPFPVNGQTDSTKVDEGFSKIFSEITDFFR